MGRPRVPTATYRLQLEPSFTFDQAAEQVAYLADLGVSHLYLSPLLAATPGSTHGYDVVDPTRVDAARGGEDGLRRLAAAAHHAGLGLIADIVPNHLGVAEPRANPAWWAVLRDGPNSRYADWFDIDWAAGPLLLPVLADDAAVAEVHLVEGPAGPELAYAEHRFPVAAGTLGGSPQQVHARQHYRLVGWRRAASDLTYRRFFDVHTLAGVRVEDPAVYTATHATVLRLVGDGVLDGLRIDHPDGLADPTGYLRWLARDTGGAWTVVEKILAPGEQLPRDWPVAGTTGYDAARLVTGAFVDPAGKPRLDRLWQQLTGSPPDFAAAVATAKREVVAGPLAAEVARLGRLAPDIAPDLIAAVLVAYPVYRSYLPTAGGAYLDQALAAAQEARPDAEFGKLAARLRDSDDPLAVRFAQTSGMVMAKSVEDTAFYREFVLLALNEVGSDPARFGVPATEWHAECAALQASWPTTMTLLSSHDTKRSEDVRARLALLSQLPERWAQLVGELEIACAPYAASVAGSDRYLLHQTLAGTGPIAADRLVAYLHKATREAKLHTSWTDPDADYDRSLEQLARHALADPGYQRALTAFLAELDPAWTRTVLAHKLLQLAMPGVPDLYQGSEHPLLSLVDPDNRRPVDYAAPPDAKSRLARTLLRLRRDRPELFDGYRAAEAGTDRALAFWRSAGLLVVVAVRAVAIGRDGWGQAALELPPGAWVDALSGRRIAGGGPRPLAELVADAPGAVLVGG